MLEGEEPRIIVIGAGSIGKRHAKNLAALGVNVTIFDIDIGQAAKVGSELRIEHAKDLDGLKTGKFEAALVCTPNHLHVQTAQMIAECGVDLFIEKPLSNTMKGVDKLIATIEGRNLVCMCGFNLRYEPGVRALKKMIVPSNVAFAEIENGSFLPGWRPNSDYTKSYSANKSMGGGIILDGVHEIDYACWLFGYPDEVLATYGRFSDLKIDVEDTVDYQLRYRDKTITVHSDYIQREYVRRCRICMRNGDVVEWVFGHHVRSVTGNGTKIIDYHETFDGNEMYVEEMREFLRCIKTRRPSESGLVNAKKILEIALAAKGEGHRS